MPNTTNCEKISKFNYLIVKAFISTNTSLNHVEDVDYEEMINHDRTEELKIPSAATFRTNIVPEVMRLLTQEIEKKLENAVAITLIVDMWTTRMMTDFIALGASLMYDNFKQEIIIIGMKRMKQAHTAEYIKICIEEMVNKYNFNKSKIKCNNLKIISN